MASALGDLEQPNKKKNIEQTTVTPTVSRWFEFSLDVTQIFDIFFYDFLFFF
jgi:hypothetical protein